MIELGHASIALGAVLGPQRLANDARSAKALQRELVLLDKLENGALHLIAIGLQVARVGAVRLVKVVPGGQRGEREHDVRQREVEHDRTEIDEPGDVEPEDDGDGARHRYVAEHVSIKEQLVERVAHRIDQKQQQELVQPGGGRLEDHGQVEHDQERVGLSEELAHVLVLGERVEHARQHLLVHVGLLADEVGHVELFAIDGQAARCQALVVLDVERGAPVEQDLQNGHVVVGHAVMQSCVALRILGVYSSVECDQKLSWITAINKKNITNFKKVSFWKTLIQSNVKMLLRMNSLTGIHERRNSEFVWHINL